MSQTERLALARKAEVGDQWKQIKSGRIATIVAARDGRGCVELKHENGRTTRKWEHYFAEQYEPTGAKAPFTDAQRLEWLVTGKGREKAARVMGSEERGWVVCDCSNGLTFFGRRDHVTFREAIDEAMRLSDNG